MVVIKLDMNQKNQYIEQYIKNIAVQVNSQYGKELIDEDKISRAFALFKDSQDDLETEIIPEITRLVQEGIANAIKNDNYKQYILIKRVADSIGNITEDEIKKFMVKNFDSIKNDDSEMITNLVITEFSSKRKNDIEIDHNIPLLIQTILNSEDTKILLSDILSNTSTIGEHNNYVVDGTLLAHNITRNDYTIEFISKYLIIHQQAFDLPLLYQSIREANICEMDENQLEQFYSNLLISSIAKRFSIENIDSIESKKQIYDFVYQNYIENGYCFQGLNGKYKESTIQNGLSSKYSRQNTSTLEEIDKIFEKHGLDKIFYSKLSETKLAPYFYMTDSMSIAYHYSYHNPEWFSYFVASGNDMPDSEYDKTAYYRKDYVACKNNLTKLCKQYNLSKEETQFVIDNYDNFWNDIVSEKDYGSVAFVHRKLINRNNVNFNINELEQQNITEIVSKLLKSNYTIDVQFIDIPPEHIDVIDVPLLTSFYDKSKIDSSSKRKYIKLENGEKYYYDILIHADAVGFDCISIINDEHSTMETKNSAYNIPIDIIKCSKDLNKDSILENGNTSFQNLEMMIAVNGVANSEVGKKIIEKARSDYSPEYMKNYYYHLSQMFCDIASDNNYSIQDRASVLIRMAKDIYPKAYLMEKTGKYPQFINEDKKVNSYLDYQQRLMLKDIEKMRNGENGNVEIIERFTSVFKDKLEGKIDKNFTPEFENQIFKMRDNISSRIEKQPKSIQQTPQESRKQKSFAQRSQSEIQVHNQIKEKNQAIKQQKEQQRQMNKPKVKTLTQSPNASSTGSKGFANVIILSLIVIFGCGALFMVMYMLIKG